MNIENYLRELSAIIIGNDIVHQKINALANEFSDCRNRGGCVFLLGNGGSAAICSHAAVDLTKNAGIKAQTFNESSLITCFSNDYSHERWMENALMHYASEGDFVVLISSSGESTNLINASKYCLNSNIKHFIFTGFNIKNQLRLTSRDGLELYADSTSYNFVENAHQVWLLCAVDICVNKRIQALRDNEK